MLFIIDTGKEPVTVGIASVCRQDGTPTAVAADRMVTVGEQGGVEYEDTESKIEHLIDNDHVSAVAVGAGLSTYIDEIFRRFPDLLEHADGMLQTMDEVNNYLLAAYQHQVRSTIENQILQPYGYTLPELKDRETQIPSGIQEEITDQVDDVIETVTNRVHVVLAGVGANNAKIYTLVGMDSHNYTDIGYSVIGSGSDSARLTFIRRGYDRTCPYREGVFTVLEAKSQAEERQGVGQRTDLVSITESGIDPFTVDERADLQDKLTKIEEEEKEARQSVMDEWDSSIS